MYKTAQYSPELSALCSTGVGGPRDSPTTHAGIAGLVSSLTQQLTLWGSRAVLLQDLQVL